MALANYKRRYFDIGLGEPSVLLLGQSFASILIYMNNIWKKVIWAVDPFIEDNSLLVSAMRAIQLLTANMENIQVEPVYILNQFPLGVPLNFPPEIVIQTQEAGQEELLNLNRSVGIKNLLPLQIISQPFLNQREITESLIKYVKACDANLIVASTHAKSGLKRWFVGSFVENLMLYSDVPIFTVNPHWKPVSHFQDVLFATDFSEESIAVFDQVVDLAVMLKSRVTIFHRVLYAVNSSIEETFAAYPFFKEAFELEIKSRQIQAARLADTAKSRGVGIDVYLDYNAQGSVVDAILKYSKRKHSIIAMVSKSGKLSANILGSTARKTIRGATYPVWVVHPLPKVQIRHEPEKLQKPQEQEVELPKTA